MKGRKISFAILVFLTLLIFSYYFLCSAFILPDSYVVLEGSSVKYALPFGVIPDKTVEVTGGGKLKDRKLVENTDIKKTTLNLFGLIPIKEVSVNTVKNELFYSSGECIGIKMHSKGILITGFSDFETANGICISPGAASGLEAGDIIISVNGVETSSVKEFTEILDKKNGECVFEILRGEKKLTYRITPEVSKDGHRRMGIYVKNSVAGVGTMTYVEKDSLRFAALGHGVTDANTGVILPMQSATLYKTQILNIKKGQKGIPGEIAGALDEGNLIGECTANSSGGIFGVLTSYTPHGEAMYAAPRNKVEKGDAKIICTVDKSNTPREYSVEILSVNRLYTSKTKSFVIKVTDKELLDKTGGIIQGMSGSPVIQNGKLVGAVTHVFVNDPTRGYGIFIENMLSES